MRLSIGQAVSAAMSVALLGVIAYGCRQEPQTDAEREVQKATEYRERNYLPLSAAQITSQGNGWLLFCMKIEKKDRWFLYRPARYGARDLDGAPLLVQAVTQ